MTLADLIAAAAYLFPDPIWVVAFVALSLDGLFIALAVLYRRQVKRLRSQLWFARRRNNELRAEIDATIAWHQQLDAAREVVQIVENDPMEQIAADPKERFEQVMRMYNAPSFIPDHERGQQ